MSVAGLPELLKKLSSMSEKGARIASASVNAVGDLTVADAKERAPADLGKIRQGIIKEQISQFQVAIAATAPESAFQEFGTGGKVVVPEEMADVASQFQGAKSGGMVEFILALTGWIMRHGIVGTKGEKPEQIAWAMAKVILAEGLTPQPFLFPAWVTQSAKLVPMLEKAFEQLVRDNQH